MPSSSKPKYETGTSNHEDVDYDWLPKETIKQLSKTNSFKINFIQFYFFYNQDKSPNPAKPSSPRQRRTKKE